MVLPWEYFIKLVSEAIMLPQFQVSPLDEVAAAAVVTKATIRAAGFLQVSGRELGAIVGLSNASVSRMKSNGYRLEGKSFELSLLFIRMYRSLDAIMAGDSAAASSWLRNSNLALNEKPIELVQKIEGLMRTVNYLDSRRAAV